MKKVFLVSVCLMLILSLFGCQKKSKIETINYTNGAKYVGQVKDGQPNGKGKMTYSTGDSLEGTFVNGVIQGNGVAKDAKGGVYKGNFVEGKMSGKGVLTSKEEGYVYTGNFKEGKFNGQGTLKFADGRTIKGKFKDGQLDSSTDGISVSNSSDSSTSESGTYSADAGSGN